jgi:hypothetical protein
MRQPDAVAGTNALVVGFAWIRDCPCGSAPRERPLAFVHV